LIFEHDTPRKIKENFQTPQNCLTKKIIHAKDTIEKPVFDLVRLKSTSSETRLGVIYEWTIAGTFARAMVLKILSLELLT
jgi:hypothetical protein